MRVLGNRTWILSKRSHWNCTNHSLDCFNQEFFAVHACSAQECSPFALAVATAAAPLQHAWVGIVQCTQN